jgi:hypothetical protein
MQRIRPLHISSASLSSLQHRLCQLPNACSSSSTILSRRPSLALALPAYPLRQHTRTMMMMMAGHSKWKKIKHGKGNADGKKKNNVLFIVWEKWCIICRDTLRSTNTPPPFFSPSLNHRPKLFTHTPTHLFLYTHNSKACHPLYQDCRRNY